MLACAEMFLLTIGSRLDAKCNVQLLGKLAVIPLACIVELPYNGHHQGMLAFIEGPELSVLWEFMDISTIVVQLGPSEWML